MVAAMGLTLVGQAADPQQQTTPLPQGPTPQQSTIPDAPRPQTPGVSGVTPGKGTTPTNNGLESTSAVEDPDQAPVDSTLPQSKVMPADDSDTPPELPGAGKGPGVFTLRTGVNFVEIPFTVKDSKGRLVPGLTYRDVRVYENGARQHMQVFTVDPFPLSVALVIDQSLPFDVMNRVNSALGALPSAFAAYDEVAVFTYNNGPKMQTAFTGGQSARLPAVIEQSKSTGREPYYYAPGEGLGGGININGGQQEHINPLTTGHGPGSPQGVAQVPRESHTLNDAILEAAKATAKAARGRRRVIYVISDGKEYGSVAKTKQVIEYLQTNKIQVYATLVGDSSVSGLGFVSHLHLPLMMRDNLLPVYTTATGGEFYAEYRTKGIEESFSKITAEQRNEYTIGYNTREPFIDGKFRKVEVRVLRPNLEVIAKDGYYPSAMDARSPQVQPISGNVAPNPGTPPPDPH